jgi:hypothetical protein
MQYQVICFQNFASTHDKMKIFLTKALIYALGIVYMLLELSLLTHVVKEYTLFFERRSIKNFPKSFWFASTRCRSELQIRTSAGFYVRKIYYVHSCR